MNTADTSDMPDDEPKRDLDLAWEEKELKPFGVGKIRIADQDIFPPMDAAQAKLHKLIGKPDQYEFLRQELNVSVNNEEGEATSVKVDRRAAISLAVGVRDVIKRAPKTGKTESTVPNYLLVHMNRDVSAEELVEKYPGWKGPLQALAICALDEKNEEIMKYLEQCLPSVAMQSTGEFVVDAPYNVHGKILAVSTGILRRLAELCEEEEKLDLIQMRGWRNWSRDIRAASPDDVDTMADVYRTIRIEKKVLEDLVTPMSGIKQKALIQVREEGGFLHDVNKKELRNMVKNGVTSVLCESDDDKNIIGYYGVLTDRDAVLKEMQSYYGYKPKMRRLPKESELGRLKWINETLASRMFENIEHMALGVEIVVKKDKTKRNSGMATALKHEVYSKVLKDDGLVGIVMRYFDILEVNGIPVPSAANHGSRRFIETLGGKQIGLVEEEFTRRDGVELKVNWFLYYAEVRESLDWIESSKAK